MLKFYVKIFRISLLLNYMMDLAPIGYYDRYWSKVFISTISTHDRDLEVEVTDLVFKLKVSLKFLRPHYFLILPQIWFIFGMVITIGPNFASSIHTPLFMLGWRSQSCQNFHIKILSQSFYDLITSKPNYEFNLYLVSWYTLVQSFYSTISTYDHDLGIEVTDLEF